MPSLNGLAGSASQDCYKQIGVYGDGSCPALVEHVHCRNCPVFAAAARAQLDRELPEDYRADWARHYAQVRGDDPAELGSVLVFRIGAEWLALPTQAVEEVRSLRSVHALPHRKGGVVLGIANIRGELIVCVSLGVVLGAEPQHATPDAGRTYQRLIVLGRAASRFAACVDEVHGMLRFEKDELTRPPATLGKAKRTFTTGVLPWGERAVGCLDDERLFDWLERSLG